MGPRAGLDGCGKSRPTGIRSPDRPARSESLYRLSYRGQFVSQYFVFPLLASFHDCSTVIVILILILSEGQAGGALEPSSESLLFQTLQNWTIT